MFKSVEKMNYFHKRPWNHMHPFDEVQDKNQDMRPSKYEKMILSSRNGTLPTRKILLHSLIK